MRAWLRLCAVLVLASCSKTQPAASPASAASLPTASASSTFNPPASVGPTSTRCHTADLSLSLEPGSGVAGSFYEWIALKDSSGPVCTLLGYPGVSLTNSAGAQLGHPAERNPVYTPHVVTLHPSESGYALVRFPNSGNFPPGQCTADAANMRVFPPDELRSLLASTSHPHCPGFSVSAIVATRS